ncbi:MAG TPA: magnesium transporter [Usitatibacteraceae bacterium]|nr:magnesium transporter [Usitatibacteraceae bacterium]
MTRNGESPPTTAELEARPAPEAAILLATCAPAVAVPILMQLNPALAQGILDRFDATRQAEILAAAPAEVSAQWRRNRAYGERQIGRLMEPVHARFDPTTTVGEAVEVLRTKVQSAFITYSYVTSQDGRLLGLVTMRDLLFSPADQTLEHIMLREVFTLPPELSISDAMRATLNRHFPVYPVCDTQGCLLGLVRGQVLFAAEAFEITAQVGSLVGVEKEERISTPMWKSFRFRHPWLQLNLLTAFLAGGVVAMFQGTIDRLVILAAFLPVLAGQSGNTGCQALAVTLRGITLGEIKPGDGKMLIMKEGVLGALNGAPIGLIAGVAMYLTATGQHSPHALILALVVFLAMVGACMVSGVSGAIVPLTLKRFGADPATASSIFLTTATDIVSMGMLLGLATMLVR